MTNAPYQTRRRNSTNSITSKLADGSVYIAAIVVCCWLLGPIINQAYYNGPSVVNDKFAVYYNEPLTPFWRALYSMDLLTTRSPAAAAAAAAAAAHNTTTRQQKNNWKNCNAHKTNDKKNIDETGAERSRGRKECLLPGEDQKKKTEFWLIIFLGGGSSRFVLSWRSEQDRRRVATTTRSTFIWHPAPSAELFLFFSFSLLSLSRLLTRAHAD